MEILWIWQNNLRITLSLFTLHPILLEALKSVSVNKVAAEIQTNEELRNKIDIITKKINPS